MTDEQIIDLMTARNEQALTEVETKYSRLCESITRRILGDEEDAKECVNDTLMALWNAIPPNRPKSLGAYAAKIARNLALNRYKSANAKKRRSNAVAVSLEELAECLPSVQQLYDRERMQAFRDKFMRSCDGHSTRRIEEMVFGRSLQMQPSKI